MQCIIHIKQITSATSFEFIAVFGYAIGPAIHRYVLYCANRSSGFY